MSLDKTVKINIKAESKKATDEVKRLKAELNNLGKASKAGNASLKSTTKQLDQTSRSFASLTKHVSQLAVIYGAFQGLNTTVRTFAEFEASISRLGVISNATSVELSAMRDTAEHLGETTIFTATQVSSGMNAMAMAGFTAKESMEGIAGVLDISAIGLVSVEDSALIATRAMNGFGLEATDIGRVSDVLSKTITTSAVTMEQLGSALQKVAPVAKNVGLSLEETSAVLGVLHDAGRLGAEAGTQLKIVLSRLSGNREANKAIKELGIQIYDVRTGQLLPFTEQLRNVKDAMDKLPPAVRAVEMSKIFGEEAKSSALIALNSIDEIVAKTVELEDAYGFASSTAKKMMDNLQGDWKEFNSAMEGVIITLGEGLSPVLRTLLDEATEFLQGLDKKEVEEFGEGVGELVEVLAGLIKGVIKIAGAIKDFSTTVSEITGISGAMQVKLLLLSVAMGKLYSQGVKLTKSFIFLNGTMTALEASKKALLITTGKVTIATRLATIAQKAWNLALNANPLGRLLVVVTSVYFAMDALVSSYKELRDATKEAGEVIDASNDVLSTTKDELLALDTAGRRAFNDYTRGLIKKTQKEIKKLNDLIEEENSGLTTNHKAVSDMTKARDTLKKKLEGLLKMEKTLVDVNKEAIQIAKDKIKIAQDELQAVEDEKKATKELLETQEKFLKAQKKNNQSRLKSGEQTLISLYKKEQQHIKKLADLEKELANIRKKFSDDRVGLNLDYETRIANLRAKGLTDLEKYYDAQKRSEVLLTKAKEAFAKGNLEVSKKYLDEYDTLIAISAGEEISHMEKVKVYDSKTKKFIEEERKKVDLTRETTLNKALTQDKNSHDLRLQFSKTEETRAIALHNIKIDNAKTQLELDKLAILSQISYLENLAKIAGITTGMKVGDLNFDAQKAQIAGIDKALLALEDRKRKVTLDIATKGSEEARKTVDDLSKPVTTDVNFDTGDAEKDADRLKDETEKEAVIVDFGFDLKQAEADLARVQQEAETDTSAEHTLKVINAINAVQKLQQLAGEPTNNEHDVLLKEAIARMNTFRANISKPTSSTHTVTVKTKQAKQARKNGGIIFPEAPMMKFNNGGSPLENGKGHSRKTGKLSGYGGGDKVKALLEAGEFIIRKEAVQKLGLDRLHTLNQGKMPRYKTGGVAGSPALPAFTESGSVNTPTKTVNLNLTMGGETFNMQTDDQIANALEKYIRKNQ